MKRPIDMEPTRSRGGFLSMEKDSMSKSIEPRPYDLSDPEEVARLLREIHGYLHTCRREHHGTDFSGRAFAMTALQEMIDRPTPSDLMREVREFHASVELLLDWMNGNDLAADHADQKPEDFARLSSSLERLSAKLGEA